MNLIYSTEQIRKAAKFIWKKNPSIPKWPDAPESVSDLTK